MSCLPDKIRDPLVGSTAIFFAKREMLKKHWLNFYILLIRSIVQNAVLFSSQDTVLSLKRSTTRQGLFQILSTKSVPTSHTRVMSVTLEEGTSTCQCDGEWTPVSECRKCKYGQWTSPWSHILSWEPQREIEIFRSHSDTDTRIWIYAIYLSLVSMDTSNLLIASERTW